MPITRRPAPASAKTASRPGPQAVAASQPSQQSHQSHSENGGSFMSLNPQDFTQGGLLDDVDVLFKQVRFVSWDYKGAIDTPVLALFVEMEYDDRGKQATVEQYYSAGDLSRFVPSDDGTHAVAVGQARGMADSTNAAMLLKSLFDNGFPVDRLGDGDVSLLEGLLCHINRVPQPNRGGNISEKNSAGYDKTVAVVTKIHRMPWEKDTGKTARAPQSQAKTTQTKTTQTQAQAQATQTQATQASNGEPSEELVTEAITVLQTILENKGGTVAKTSISPAAFKPLTGNANRGEILALLTSDDFLGGYGEEFGWAFDGKTVSAT